MSRWQRYVDFWNEREAPDALALVRITFGVALIANVLEQLFNGDVLEYYANVGHGGIFPYEPRTAWSLFQLLEPTAATVYGLVLTLLVGSILLTVGLFTRGAALVCMVIQMTLWDRMHMWRFDADNVYRVFLYLSVLAPLGAAWSLDARFRGKGRAEVPKWPRRLFMAQLAFLYVRTGLIKLGSSWSFSDGWSALYYSVNLPGLARWPGEWAASIYPLTQVATFVAKWWEITFFLVPLSLFLRRHPGKGGRLRRALAAFDLRLLYLGMGVVLHGSLVVLMNLGMFPFVMVSLYPCYLEPIEARAVLRRLLGRGGAAVSPVEEPGQPIP